MSDETCFVPVNNQDKSYYNYLLQIIRKELMCSFVALNPCLTFFVGLFKK